MKATTIVRNIDTAEMNYLINERKNALKRRTATAPRGAFSSYITMSHNGDFIEAGYKVRKTKQALAEFLNPIVQGLRTSGKTWKDIANTLNVSAAIINEVRDFHPELNNIVPVKVRKTDEPKPERVVTPVGIGCVIAKTDTEVKVVFDQDTTRAYWYDVAKVETI